MRELLLADYHVVKDGRGKLWHCQLPGCARSSAPPTASTKSRSSTR
jgi:hypothetical protein